MDRVDGTNILIMEVTGISRQNSWMKSLSVGRCKHRTSRQHPIFLHERLSQPRLRPFATTRLWSRGSRRRHSLVSISMCRSPKQIEDFPRENCYFHESYITAIRFLATASAKCICSLPREKIDGEKDSRTSVEMHRMGPIRERECN